MVTEPSILLEDVAAPITDSGPRRLSSARRQIPWGYGRDRVTAIAVDPDQLFVFWEILDDSIDRGRVELGPAGARATLVLRVYDTSNRIFDGTNAHGFFDQDVQRNDRQWFCRIGKPGSGAHVEMGLRTPDGRFLKVARSGRVDFPRSEPAPRRPTEWMRVVAGTGDIASRQTAALAGAAHAGAPPGPPGAEAHHGGGNTTGSSSSQGGVESVERFAEFEHYELESYESRKFDFERYETDTGWQTDPLDPATVYRMVTMSWQELGVGSSSWESSPTETSWEAGPFSYPTEVIVPAAERFEGPAYVYRSGEQVRVLHGPWQVVIRGINAHSSRRVLARWEVHRSWVSVSSRSAVASAPGAASWNGEHRLGSSERHALSASELRLRGASEVFFLGASERRLGGASESRFMGASQWIARGASERLLVGGSEWRLAGASEQRLAGASERRLMGASERHLAGASERRIKGASEQRLAGGGSESRLGGASENRIGAYPPSPSRGE